MGVRTYELLLQNDINTIGNTQWFYFAVQDTNRVRVTVRVRVGVRVRARFRVTVGLGLGLGSGCLLNPLMHMVVAGALTVTSTL